VATFDGLKEIQPVFDDQAQPKRGIVVTEAPETMGEAWAGVGERRKVPPRVVAIRMNAAVRDK